MILSDYSTPAVERGSIYSQKLDFFQLKLSKPLSENNIEKNIYLEDLLTLLDRKVYAKC